MFIRNLRSKWSSKLANQQSNSTVSRPGTSQLYLALYARLKYTNSYHFALHISSPGSNANATIRTMKYHCKNIVVAMHGTVSIPWVYEAVEINPESDPRILVRIHLGDVSRVDLVEALLAEVPVVQDDDDFRCVTWARSALLQLNQAGIFERGDISDWEAVQSTALDYVDEKKKQGRFEAGWEGDTSRVSTFDRTVGREVWP